jgi:hypothetical protein
MSLTFTCPICGFNGLKEPPYNKENDPSFEICPCCGFEFGFDGENSPERFGEYRKHWIAEGTPWFNSKLKPINWDYKKQIEKIGVKEEPSK